MATNIQKLKDDIWYVKKDEQAEEAGLRQWMEQMEIVLKTLEANPDNEEVAGMSADIEAAIAGHEAKLVTLREKRAALEAQLPAEPAKAVPKFDPEQHPMLKKGLEKAEPEKPVVFNTGDVCEARWTDGLWYKAKVKTILGSASAPKFHVLFVEYNDTATLDRDALRPIQSKRKRDPEPAPTPASQPAASTPVTSTPHVISGPASVNPKAQPAAPAVPLDALEPKKRKIPNKKQLEKGVTSWKNWNSKGVGKKISQKDSMFRTGTNVNSRVGFTGSGSGMTETSKRLRYDNKAAAQADREED